MLKDNEKREKVFISFPSEKTEQAKRLKKILEKAGFDVWASFDDVNSAYHKEIPKAIENTDELIVLLCSEADKSEHIQIELNEAITNHKPILPLRIDEKINPTKEEIKALFPNIRYFISLRNWQDWFKDENSDESNEELEKLYKRIRADIEEYSNKKQDELQKIIDDAKNNITDSVKDIIKEHEKLRDTLVTQGEKIEEHEQKIKIINKHSQETDNKINSIEACIQNIKNIKQDQPQSQTFVEKISKNLLRHKKIYLTAVCICMLLLPLVGFVTFKYEQYSPVIKASNRDVKKFWELKDFYSPSNGWDVMGLAERGTSEMIYGAAENGADFNVDIYNEREIPLLQALKVNPDYEAVIAILDTLPEKADIVNGKKTFYSYPHHRTTLLGLAAIQGTNDELIKALIDYGFDVNYTDIHGLTILMLAVSYSYNIDIINLIAQSCNDINVKKKYYPNWTALMFAITNSSPEVVRTLIEAGANVDIQDYNGTTPLMAALDSQYLNSRSLTCLRDKNGKYVRNENGDFIKLSEDDIKKRIQEIVNYLRHPDVNADVNIKDKKGDYAADYARKNKYFEKDFRFIKDLAPDPDHIELSDVFGLARYGTPYQIQKSINAGFSFNVSNDTGYTPLHDAAKNNLFAKSVEFILKQGMDVNSLISSGNWKARTPLMFAAAYNPEPEITKTLLNNGANVTLQASSDYGGIDEAISFAVANNGLDVIKLIFEAETKDRQNDILSGKINYREEIIYDYETDSENSAVAKIYSTGVTLLELATEFNNQEAVKFLLEKGADVNARNRAGQTALMGAAEYSSLEIFKLLLEAGADVNIQDEALADTALTKIIQSLNNMYHINLKYEKIKLLLEAGADPNIQKKNGDTALLEFCLSLADTNIGEYIPYPGITRAIDDEPKILKLLIDAGANVNIQRKEDEATPLLIIVKNFGDVAQATFLKILIDASADVNVQDKENGSTPLLLDLEKFKDDLEYNYEESKAGEIIEMLLNAGVDVNVKNADGRYPDYFVKKGNPLSKRLQHDKEITNKVERAELHEKYGDNSVIRGDFEGAIENYNKSLVLRQEIANQTGTLQAKRNVANIYFHLAEVFSEDKNYSEAQNHCNNALKIYENISVEYPTYSINNDIDKIYETRKMFSSYATN